MKSLFEQNGGTYSDYGDYRLPDLTMPEKPEYHIGIWGQRQLDYLKKYKRVLYVNLLTSGKLTEYLYEIDMAAQERLETIVFQMAQAQNITEQLKADSQMLWVQKMSNIRACAYEIVRSEMIYG